MLAYYFPLYSNFSAAARREKVTKEERLIKNTIGRIRDARVGADGFVYLLTDESNGVLARLEPVK